MPPDYPQKPENGGEEKKLGKTKPSRLESLENNLYSNSKEALTNELDGATPYKYNLRQPISVRSEWDDEPIPEEINTKLIPTKNTLSVLKRILVGSVILFVASLCVAAYIFLGNRNVISTKNIAIGINIPSSVAGGEKLPVEISIANQNNVPLLTADILIEYSEGGREPDDLSKELRRYRETIGPVNVGEVVNKKYEVVFFGEEGVNKEIKVSLEYRVSGSNAIFSKSEVRSISLSSAPVSVSIESLSDYSAGEEATFVVTVAANASEDIQHLMLQTDYPFGFVFSGSEPKPVFNDNIWDLGDLKPGSTRTIRVRGSFSGVEGEERVVRFSVGARDTKDIRRVGVVFLSKIQTIRIARPFIEANLTLGGVQSSEYVTSAGQNVRADIVLKNNLDSRITNVVVQAKINGSIFNRSSVSGGFFRSIDNTVVWDQTNSENLAVLEPGDSRHLSFSFEILRSAINLRSPSMSVELTVTGSKVSDGASLEKVKVSTSKLIKIASEMETSTKILYSSGPFQNSGPVPPKAEQETTYTVTLSVGNSSNDLSEVRVSTGLPIYTSWLDRVSPETEKVKYNPIGGEIVWDVGELKAGAGRREVSFQIAFSPSISQIGDSPNLIDPVSASGYDRFTGVTLSASNGGSLDTNMPDDPVYQGRGGSVGN